MPKYGRGDTYDDQAVLGACREHGAIMREADVQHLMNV